MMYPDVHFLGGKLLTVGGVDVTTKAHHTTKAHPIIPLRYHHEGDSQPLAVDLKGGHQTLTNAMGVITMFDSSPKNSYPPRSLQPPGVTRSMGNAQDLLKTRFALVERWGRDGSFTEDPPRTLKNLSGI